MKILFTTLFISLLTVFATAAHAGSDGSEDQITNQAKPRLANCKDCLDAGYRRGYAEGEAAALENTPQGSSSVTTPLSYRKPVYVNAQVVKQQPRQVRQQVVKQQPRQVIQQPVKQRQPIQRIQQSAHHAGHGHHTQAQVLDCELTDSLNRGVNPVTTIISTKTYNRPMKSANHHFIQGSRPSAIMKRTGKIQHHDHSHHTHAEKADCELTDALNRGAGPVTTIMSTSSYPAHSPVQHNAKQHFSHGDHGHHSEVERADCALTDALNRGASVVRVVRKY
jgi:hypothetical protein